MVIILRGGEFSKNIEPAVVVTEGGSEDGLIAAAEIMLVISGIAIRVDGVGPDVLDDRELEFELFMAEREVRSDQMMPSRVVGTAHGIEYRGIKAGSFVPFEAEGCSCAVQSFAIDR